MEQEVGQGKKGIADQNDQADWTKQVLTNADLKWYLHRYIVFRFSQIILHWSYQLIQILEEHLKGKGPKKLA